MIIWRKMKWTKGEDTVLSQYYPHCTPAQLSEKLPGRTIKAIQARAFILGIKKTAEYIKYAPNAGRFQKGIIPYSKGKKREEYMSAESIEKCAKTQFKKGNKPHTYLPVGTEMVVGGYVYVKVADKSNVCKYENWKLKHRMLWESVNGVIPEGYIIQFKDGNPKNIVIDNLYMISRQEQMKANSITNLPNDARELLKAIARLTRLINKKEKYEQESKR